MEKLKLLCGVFVALLSACATHDPSAIVNTGVAFSATDPHWAKINGSDCWIYASWPDAGKSADWNGTCSHGLASGQGTAIWHGMVGTALVVSGTARNGVFEGPLMLDQNSTSMHVHEEISAVAGVANGFGTYEADLNGTPIMRYTGNFSNAMFNGRGRAITYSMDGMKVQDGIWLNGEFSSGQSNTVPLQNSSPTFTSPPPPTPSSRPVLPDANAGGTVAGSPQSPGSGWTGLTGDQQRAMGKFIRAAAERYFSCKHNRGETSDCLQKGIQSGTFAAIKDMFCASPVFMVRIQHYVNDVQANLISDGVRDTTYSVVCALTAAN